MAQFALIPIFAFSFARLWQADIWHALPLIVAVSLVYSATRHESSRDIFIHAVRSGVWMTGFLLAVLVVISMFSMHL